MQGTADESQNSANLSEEDQSRLIALVRRYKDQWSQDRLVLMQRCIENLEMFKGNQFISFAGGNASFFDATDWIGSTSGGNNQHSQNADDKDLYQYCNNFYQMLATGFVAALAPQVPKSKWMPEDAEQLADTTTAEAAQTLISIIEQQNREQSLLKQQLLYLYTTGAVFRHTRYVVDADRAGTKKEPIYNETETEIMPARMHCFACGKDNPAQTAQCQNCGQPLGKDSFFPAVTGPVVQKVGEKKVPNGMVAQNLYCPLEVDCDPAANNLRQTPILNLEVEVHLGALRAAYPDMYDQIAASATSELSSNGSIDRIARQQVYSQTTAYTSILSDQRPTLSRTWIQPWAFDLEDDQEFGKRMRKTYPSGLLLINTGATFLSAREADLSKEWTWAGTHEGFGLYPPSIGDIVVPFQKRYNDMANILHEFMDRCSAGVTLANADLIDTKSLQGKPMLPGILNLVKLKRTGAPGAMRMADALYQFQFEMHQEAFSYLDKLAYNAQMFAGIPPQVYGGEGDEHIETFGGQQQQLNTALGKLNIYWENIKEEHAAADEIAVECAKDNLTDDMRQVIAEKGGAFRNDYVHLDDLQGSIHAFSDTDQGLPVTAAELRQRWMDMLEAMEKNPAFQAVFDDPSNQEQAAMALGVPGMVVPGQAMRSKTLQIIDKLLEAEPAPQIDPQTNQPSGRMMPSIMPDKDIDDFTVLKATVRQYCQENFDIAEDFPKGFQNILAYLTAATAMETAFNVQQAQQQGAALAAGHMAAAPPPKPPPQLSPEEQNMLAMVRQDAAPAMGDLLKIAATPALPKGSSLQAQVAAAGKLVDLAAKVEQIAADKTTVQ
jgi:hypothetical protein